MDRMFTSVYCCHARRSLYELVQERLSGFDSERPKNRKIARICSRSAAVDWHLCGGVSTFCASDPRRIR